MSDYEKQPTPIVHTKSGPIRGYISSDRFGKPILNYQAIPYAEPPLGALRFKDPKPIKNWRHVRDCFEEGSPCYARNIIGQFEGSEDCLVLNVYAPEDALSGGQKPVMFWIHGGGFTSGSSKTDVYGPEFLVAEDVILVTINYRTNALGFLNFDEPSLEVPGNAGLKDITLALTWTKNNIEYFGGNPNNITIFGESAGSAAVEFLLLSPKTKGLFHRAIAQSGSVLNGWTKGRRNNAYDLATLLNLKGSSQEILAHLQSLPVEKLYELVDKLKDKFFISEERPFCPIVENSNKNAFLSEAPEDILNSGNYNHVPILMGFTSAEGMIVYGTMNPSLVLNPGTLVPLSLKLPKNSVEFEQTAHKIKQFYLKNENLNERNLPNLIKLYTDNYFLYGIQKAAQIHAKFTQVYFYRFDLQTELNFLKKLLNIQCEGASHADELGYLFKGILTPEFEPKSREEIGLSRMTKLWSNFAKFGNPTPNGYFEQINWMPLTKDNFQYLNISDQFTMIQGLPEKERMVFWKGLEDLVFNKKAKI